MCEGKETDLNNSKPPPPFELPGSATAKISIYTQFEIEMFSSYGFTGRIKD